ncbi:hypothetical protein JZ751_020602 [Albula glossodonta]|uniref:Uncharacterized protein n=1 Tax=Albula glossodonta TaxID=121402 RepID=A0A8T2PJ13_9TELE|nr:hypothetical protein JZ751_020602 [Albula glossodonta]
MAQGLSGEEREGGREGGIRGVIYETGRGTQIEFRTFPHPPPNTLCLNNVPEWRGECDSTQAPHPSQPHTS